MEVVLLDDVIACHVVHDNLRRHGAVDHVVAEGERLRIDHLKAPEGLPRDGLAHDPRPFAVDDDELAIFPRDGLIGPIDDVADRSTVERIGAVYRMGIEVTGAVIMNKADPDPEQFVVL